MIQSIVLIITVVLLIACIRELIILERRILNYEKHTRIQIEALQKQLNLLGLQYFNKGVKHDNT